MDVEEHQEDAFRAGLARGGVWRQPGHAEVANLGGRAESHCWLRTLSLQKPWTWKLDLNFYDGASHFSRKARVLGLPARVPACSGLGNGTPPGRAGPRIHISVDREACLGPQLLLKPWCVVHIGLKTDVLVVDDDSVALSAVHTATHLQRPSLECAQLVLASTKTALGSVPFR